MITCVIDVAMFVLCLLFLHQDMYTSVWKKAAVGALVDEEAAGSETSISISPILASFCLEVHPHHKCIFPSNRTGPDSTANSRMSAEDAADPGPGVVSV